MHQTLKIILAIIITAAIVGGGVYYWQNSKTPSETPQNSEPVTNPTPQPAPTTNKLPKINQLAKQPSNESSNDAPPESTNYNETADWTTYTNLGITLKYPSDGTYSVETPEDNQFIITQPHPGNRIHVTKTNDISDLPETTSAKNIMGTIFKQFQRDGIGLGYGYILEQSGQYYVFESVWGPENEIFELLMTTIDFDKSKFTTQDLGNDNWQFTPAEVKSVYTKNSTTYLSIDLLSINPDFVPGETSFFINQTTDLRNLATNSKTLSYNCGAGLDEDYVTPDVSTPIQKTLENIEKLLAESSTPIYHFDIQNDLITAIYESCLP